jgi:1,4-alpha-glucan branching enzyme
VHGSAAPPIAARIARLLRSPGLLALVLHAHLPFVRHPENDDHLEERWLFEALAESYLPLLDVFTRLADEGVPYRLTLGVTPTLAAMLGDPLLGARFVRYLARLARLAERERARVASSYPLVPALDHAIARAARVARVWEASGGDVLGALGRLADAGHLELAGGAATHGFLPGLAAVPGAVEAQLGLGVDAHRTVFGRAAHALWLPECGYARGFDRVLARLGVRATVLDAHGLRLARPRPPFDVYAPVLSSAGVAFFARDPEASEAVWSREVGYPGDPAYREYHRDAVDVLPRERLADVLPPIDARVPTGLKLWRITGGSAPKEPYDPRAAAERARVHAAHFVAARRHRLDAVRDVLGGPAPVCVAPYDAELFGHWWHEGPLFLEHVLRAAAPWTTTLSAQLARTAELAVVEPAPSTWGEEGQARVWLGAQTASLWPAVHSVAREVSRLAERHRSTPDPLARRVLAQACREALLAQASDWPFLVHTRTAPHYARARLDRHVADFRRLAAALDGGPEVLRRELSGFSRIESRDNLLPRLEPARFCEEYG